MTSDDGEHGNCTLKYRDEDDFHFYGAAILTPSAPIQDIAVLMFGLKCSILRLHVLSATSMTAFFVANVYELGVSAPNIRAE